MDKPKIKLHKEIISSGSFVISKQKPSILEALLGTCVGVALVDKKAEVAGLYHILLPETTSHSTNRDLENYASTGMPIFINEMLKSGASLERMEATIAGGALVGPVSHRDLDLDIGGRTTRVANKILDAQKIKIVKSETGGYFSCRLQLSLQNFECKIEPLGFVGKPIEAVNDTMIKENIDLAIQRVRPIPQIALRVTRMINSMNYEMKDIASEVRQDQVLTAKILNICNSTLYSPKKRIESIDQALIMMGEKTILLMVVSSSMETFFNDLGKGYSLTKGGIYQHAIGTAYVAEKLAKLLGNISSDIAYTAGLLHDIGKVVLDQYVSKVYPLFYRRLMNEEICLIDVENETLKTNHTEVGARLAKLWDLPEALTEVITYHHDPVKAQKHRDLTRLVYIADLLMSRFSVGNELDRISTDELLKSMDSFGLKYDEFDTLVDYIPWKKFAGEE